ncbi:hypothetical protein C8J34_12211 [Rhizobium sp. PP-F2F-G36]|nr:hypothetical protein C8J34_12211 [Rhizobium sp. PP-F2F-G36]
MMKIFSGLSRQFVTFAVVVGICVWLFSNPVMLYMICALFWIVLIAITVLKVAPVGDLLPRLEAALRNVGGGANAPASPAVSMPTSSPPVSRRQPDRRRLLEEGIRGITELVGLDGVRRGLEDLLDVTEHTGALRNRMRGLSQGTLFVLSGSRGTGRMTVAANLAKIFYGLGLTELELAVKFAPDSGRGRSAGELYTSVFEAARDWYDHLIVFEDADWLMENEAAAVGRALSDAAQQAPGRLWIVMVGSPRLGHRLKTTPEVRTAWQKAFVIRDIPFDELDDIHVSNILDNYIARSETRWDNLAKKRFVRSISEGRSSASFANVITVRQLFEDSVRAGVSRVRNQASMTITEADVERAAEHLAL